MNKKVLISLVAIIAIASYENIYAHGVGGGDRSYKFDKNDNAADHEAEKKVAEEQEASDDWDDFMSKIKAQEAKPDSKKEQESESGSMSNQ